MRMRSPLPFLLPLLALALAAAALKAQVQAGQPFLEQVEVEVVNVDVHVTDSAGKPVQGLGKGDFELLEDGKPVSITNFAAVTGDRLPVEKAAAPAPSPAAASPSPAAPPLAEEQRLHLVIYVDNFNLNPAH